MLNDRAQVDLSRFANPEFDRGASLFKEALWLLISRLLFEWPPVKFYALKAWTLRRFGARIGRGAVIKPGVKITFPWKLTLGDHVWLGEQCWIHNLAPVTLGDHVCVSQRAMLCAGSHDYKSRAFDLITRPITLERGVWIGACAFVGPGVTAQSHAVLTANSVAARDLEPFTIYKGNPALPSRRRELA